MAERFEEVLSECIDRLLQGESVEQCLQRYPEQAAELEPLLRVGLATRRAVSVEPRPEFKAQTRYQVSSLLHQRQQKRRGERLPILGWLPRWATAAVVVVLVFLVAGGGTVAAASDSMPGDTLYSVKLATEHVQLFFTFSDAGKAKLYAKLAERRMQEMEQIAEQADHETIETLAERLDTSLEKVRELTARLRQGGPEAGTQAEDLRQQLQRNAARGLEMLDKLRGEAPDDSRPAFDSARSKLAQGYRAALDALGERPSGR